jgi:3-isopropylmalate/(R)-2-methylmalate dehydratase small subunit
MAVVGMPLAIRRITGHPLPLPGRHLDTDRILPARFLRTVTFEGLEAYLFADDRAARRETGDVHPIDDPRFAGATILIVESNFGCGSSREHAPQAIRRHGIRAIVGESFADIFHGNAAMMGLPCVTASSESIACLMETAARDPLCEVSIDLETLICRTPAREIRIALPEHSRQSFLSGTWDSLAALLDRYADVERQEAQLGYGGWRQSGGR